MAGLLRSQSADSANLYRTRRRETFPLRQTRIRGCELAVWGAVVHARREVRLLLRATKKHHFSSKDTNFPCILSFRADGGNEKDVSMYNMEFRPDVKTAWKHAEKFHDKPPLGFIGITVGECLDAGVKVVLDNDPNDEELWYHANIYLNEDKTVRSEQRRKPAECARVRGWVELPP